MTCRRRRRHPLPQAGQGEKRRQGAACSLLPAHHCLMSLCTSRVIRKNLLATLRLKFLARLAAQWAAAAAM